MQRRLGRGPQPLNDRIDMQHSRVEYRQISDHGRSQKQRQLGAAEYDAVDLLGISEPRNQRREFFARLIAKIALEQLADIALMNPGPVRFSRRDHLEIVSRKDI